jgi:UDP-glucose 4-epimerase
MSVLVTGGAGYIGSHMVLELLAAGEPVVVLDDLSTGHRWAVADEAILIVGDIGDRQLVSKIIADHNVNAIIHFAGSIVVSESVADPLAYHNNNTIKTHALIEAAHTGKIRHFIFSSSAAVYGMPEQNPVFEKAPLNPISPYGSSKMMSEYMLKETSIAHDFDYVALRYFNVAGADPRGRVGESRHNVTHLIEVAAQVAHGQRDCFNLFGDDYQTPDGTCIRDYIHVSDLARAHMSALRHLRSGGASKVLNCGYGQGYSVREVIEAFKKAVGVEFPVKISSRRAGDPDSLVAGADLIGQELSWRPCHDDLDTMVRQAYAWEKHLMETGFRK